MPQVQNPKLTKTQKRSYSYAFALHDLIVAKIIDAEHSNSANLVIEGLDSEQLAELEALGDGDIIDWLECHGFESQAREVLRRHLIMALTSDFCHFVYESLNAAAKAKMSVAYTLIRKPIKENLLFLEWILGDPGNFFQQFDQGDPQLLDLARALSPDQKKCIIELAINKSNSASLPADEMYRIRYDKHCEHGFECLCNKAIHLVTTHKGFTTERQNLNFIFSSYSQIHEQQDYFFGMLPLILLHCLSVTEKLFGSFSEVEHRSSTITNARMYVGLCIYQLGFGVSNDPKRSMEMLAVLLREASIEDVYSCDGCEDSRPFSIKDAVTFYQNGETVCQSCGLVTNHYDVGEDLAEESTDGND